MKDNKTILLSGGGTAGSVTPLLALTSFLKHHDDYQFLFVGTKTGIERELVSQAGLPFVAVSSGKLRRYFSWKNFSDLILFFIGFWQSLLIVIRTKPSMMISAGSFVSVPLAWVCACLRVPIFIIQLDVRPGLANKLMAPFAQKIAVVFEKSLQDYGKKAVWVSAPFASQTSLTPGKGKGIALDIKQNDLPLVLVMGGGTGSDSINQIIKDNIDELAKLCRLVHLSGFAKDLGIKHESYQSFEFLNHQDVLSIMQDSLLVISRAGLGTIIELANLNKPAIIIPLPHTHQEDNARALSEKEAAIVLSEDNSVGEKLLINMEKIIQDRQLQNKLSRNIGSFMKKDQGQELAEIIRGILEK